MLTDQQEYLDAGVNQCVFYIRSSETETVVGEIHWLIYRDVGVFFFSSSSSVLTKPVYEKSIKAMLAIAHERRKRGGTGVTSENLEPPSPTTP